jgi:flagellar assembly protein FliH
MTSTPAAPTQKFLFARSFDGASSLLPPDTKVPPPPTYSQADLDAACALAKQQGYAAGEQALQHSQQAQLVTLTQQLEHTLTALLAGATTRQAQDSAQLAAIALQIARKILPPSVAEQALDGIAAQVAQVCKAMNREPRLVVRVADAQLDPLRQRLDAIIQRQTFAGKIILLAEASLGQADCVIEWADGGIERDAAKLWQQIEQAVQLASAHAESATDIEGDNSMNGTATAAAAAMPVSSNAQQE